MLITILGCGTSTGVPLPGCRCSVCTSKHPRNSRNRSSALITTDSARNILIDATPDLRLQALHFDIRHIDAVLYTHAHADHILGTDDLRSFNFVSGKPIPCFGTAATLESLKHTFSYIFNQNEAYEGGMLAQLSLHEFVNGEKLKVADTELLTLKLLHGKSEVSGFHFGELAYATDCNKIPSESIKKMTGVKYLIIDGLRHQEHRTHFTIKKAIETAKIIGAEHTYLTHMSHTVDYKETSQELPPGISLAYDGLKLEFKGNLN